MKNILSFLLLFISVFSCKKAEINCDTNPIVTTCGITDPIKELSWLSDKIPTTEVSKDDCAPYKVIQGVYQDKPVFIISTGGSTCRVCGNVVYNCAGEAILVCNREEEAKISDQKVIWER
ncbi:MAG: hypothetical protein V4714_05120 [Bacteroidota bacterium]